MFIHRLGKAFIVSIHTWSTFCYRVAPAIFRVRRAKSLERFIKAILANRAVNVKGAIFEASNQQINVGASIQIVSLTDAALGINEMLHSRNGLGRRVHNCASGTWLLLFDEVLLPNELEASIHIAWGEHHIWCDHVLFLFSLIFERFETSNDASWVLELDELVFLKIWLLILYLHF